MTKLAALLQSAGMAAAVVAGWMVAVPLGVLVLAVALIVSGLAVERRN